MQRTYDHNGHTDLPIGFPQLSDVEMAGKVRILMRGDLDHEAVCTGARDRILALMKERDAANAILSRFVTEWEATWTDPDEVSHEWTGMFRDAKKLLDQSPATTSDSELVDTQMMIDILLMVFGGGGEYGLPDPDEAAMVSIIEKWTQEQRELVADYAGAIQAVASDNHGVEVPERPQCLTDLCDELGCQFA